MSETKTVELPVELWQMLITEVMDWHSSPTNSDYNGCDTDPCNWCVTAKRSLAAAPAPVETANTNSARMTDERLAEIEAAAKIIDPDSYSFRKGSISSELLAALKAERDHSRRMEYEADLFMTKFEAELESNAALKRGEFICQKCLLRKDSEFERGDF